MFNLEKLVRQNIRNLKPYSSARSEFAGSAEIFLDANENALGSPAGNGLNRYPDPLQRELKQLIATSKGVSPSQIFLGNGSDEAIDLLFRVFCQPGRDEAIICPPTYGMYRVSADINDVLLREGRLTSEFQLDVPEILNRVSESTKLIFLCSPNNPTGNLIDRASVLEIAQLFMGIVVVDEAYIDFASEPSMIKQLSDIPNLVVLQTFSKAWGMAGVRVGIAFASEAIIELLNRVKPPYNVSSLAQKAVIDAFDDAATVADWIRKVKDERARLADELNQLSFVRIVYPSEANFLLVKVDDANAVYRFLIDKKIVVRNRNNVEACEGGLRITVGAQHENQQLLSALRRYAVDTEAR